MPARPGHIGRLGGVRRQADTQHAVAFTLVILEHHPGAVWVLAPFTVLVAMSRVILGVHYPSDVAAGATLGSLLGALVLMA